VPGTPSEARTLALDKLSQPLWETGYKLAEQTPSALTFNRSSFFGGPLRLFARTTATITMTFEESNGSTRIVIAGTAPRRVARQIEQAMA
jgi:hypothetical protein